MDFDLILVGGGLANGLIALRLAQQRPELRVAIVEAGATLGGNHTWSSFEADLTPDQRRWTAPLVVHRWDRYTVRFPRRTRTLETGYVSSTSERLAEAVSAALPADRIFLSAPAVQVDIDGVTLADQRRLTARAVIDGRGQAPSPHMNLRWQKFTGLELQLAAPHGLDGPVIMDATVPQLDGYRFLYALPFGPRTLLVEDTYFSDGEDLSPDTVRQRALDDAREQGWQVEAILREEVGILPMALSGDIQALWADATPDIALVGLRAGLFHPATGYSFPDAVRTADVIAALPRVDGHSVFEAVRAHSVRTWRARGFYRYLNRLLFEGAEPAERYKVLQRFYGLNAKLVGRFYAGQSTFADQLRTLIGKPPIAIGRAIRVSLNTMAGR